MAQPSPFMALADAYRSNREYGLEQAKATAAQAAQEFEKQYKLDQAKQEALNAANLNAHYKATEAISQGQLKRQQDRDEADQKLRSAKNETAIAALTLKQKMQDQRLDAKQKLQAQADFNKIYNKHIGDFTGDQALELAGYAKGLFPEAFMHGVSSPTGPVVDQDGKAIPQPAPLLDPALLQLLHGGSGQQAPAPPPVSQTGLPQIQAPLLQTPAIAQPAAYGGSAPPATAASAPVSPMPQGVQYPQQRQSAPVPPSPPSTGVMSMRSPASIALEKQRLAHAEYFGISGDYKKGLLKIDNDLASSKKALIDTQAKKYGIEATHIKNMEPYQIKNIDSEVKLRDAQGSAALSHALTDEYREARLTIQAALDADPNNPDNKTTKGLQQAVEKGRKAATELGQAMADNNRAADAVRLELAKPAVQNNLQLRLINERALAGRVSQNKDLQLKYLEANSAYQSGLLAMAKNRIGEQPSNEQDYQAHLNALTQQSNRARSLFVKAASDREAELRASGQAPVPGAPPAGATVPGGASAVPQNPFAPLMGVRPLSPLAQSIQQRLNSGQGASPSVGVKKSALKGMTLEQLKALQKKK